MQNGVKICAKKSAKNFANESAKIFANKSAKIFANESAKNSAKCVKNCVIFFYSCVKFLQKFCTFQIYTAFSDHVKIALEQN